MACVVKVQNLEENTTLGDLRRTFKERGARPADIHITPSNNGKPRIGFVVFRDRKEADIGLRVDGAVCRDCRIIVKPSSPKEFDRMFPGKPMLTSPDDQKNSNYNKGKNDQQRNHSKDARGASSGPGVVKLDNIDLSAGPSDIRRFFKDHDARPADIHLVQGNTGKHDGSAFLVFNMENEADNALELNGTMFFKKRLSVKLSSPKEFDRYFPRVAMLSAKPANNRGGRGRGRGGLNTGNGRNVSPPTPNNERGRNSMRGGRGGGRGGAFGGKQQGRGGDQFFGSRGGDGDNQNNGRGRSRSPINRRRDSNAGGNDSFDRRRLNTNPEPLGPINERKFLRISGLPYNASQVDIQEFFRPILTRDIYIIRNVGGKYAGKFNGSALIEFFSDGDARQAMKMDGNKFGNNRVQVVQASKDEIARTIQENKFSGDPPAPPAPPVPDASALNAIAQSNPQVQHLLTLLTATVNTIAGAAAAAVAQPKPDVRPPRGGARGNDRVDPVINRVASSANIDVSDIKQGRVVGLRNLPYAVTTDEILHFFRNYKVLPDSVRIHQLDDGRCSGDAIVSFRGNRDARNAVSELNKGSIGRRKVELFFL